MLLRHGRTDLNRRRLLQGASDLPLDDVGRRQAVEAGDYVRRHWKIDKVVSSPRRRARETVALAGFGTDATTDDRLAEMDYGELEGTPVPVASGELFDAWSADPGYAPAGGESLTEVYERSVAAAKEILAASANQTVLMCSHANPIKAVVSWTLGTAASGILRMYLRQASVSVVAQVPPALVLLGFNERTEAS
ncbi:MAG: histidine phosphatase family protein [bacterium]|nr:histidine phosphatase family protein [bacterium]MCY4103982.1 histidine phosphatase family protein [bacterium]